MYFFCALSHIFCGNPGMRRFHPRGIIWILPYFCRICRTYHPMSWFRVYTYGYRLRYVWSAVFEIPAFEGGRLSTYHIIRLHCFAGYIRIITRRGIFLRDQGISARRPHPTPRHRITRTPTCSQNGSKLSRNVQLIEEKEKKKLCGPRFRTAGHAWTIIKTTISRSFPRYDIHDEILRPSLYQYTSTLVQKRRWRDRDDNIRAYESPVTKGS